MFTEIFLQRFQIRGSLRSILGRRPRREFLLTGRIKGSGFHLKQYRVGLEGEEGVPDAFTAIDGGCASGRVKQNETFGIDCSIIEKGNEAYRTTKQYD